MELELFAAFKPDGDALLRRVSRHIDDAALEYIANIDLGLSFGEHISELRKIRDQGIIDRPLTWQPGEALNLARWGEPDGGGDRGEPLGIAGHWVRAFCCAALMRAFGDAETREIEDSCDATMIQLLESLRHLDAGLEPEAMAAFAWLITRLVESEEAVGNDILFAGVGLLSLAVKAKSTVSEATISELTEWLLAREKQEFDDCGQGTGEFPYHWLFWASNFMRPEKWMALGTDLAAFEGTGRCAEAVRSIGQRLSRGKPEL